MMPFYYHADIIELFSAYVHDLEIIVEVCILRHLDPIYITFAHLALRDIVAPTLCQ